MTRQAARQLDLFDDGSPADGGAAAAVPPAAGALSAGSPGSGSPVAGTRLAGPSVGGSPAAGSAAARPTYEPTTPLARAVLSREPAHPGTNSPQAQPFTTVGTAPALSATPATPATPASLAPPAAQAPAAPEPPPAVRARSGSDGRIDTPCPPSLPAGARWRETATEQQPIGYVLLRSRRRSIGFVIGDDGLRVTAPNWVTLGQIDDAVREKSRWILSKLRDWHARRERLAMSQTRWQAGGELPYLGRRIVLQPGLDPAAGASARPTARGSQASYSGDADAPRDGDVLWLGLPQEADHTRIRDSAQAWLQRRATLWFGARLQAFQASSGLVVKRWRLSSAATRWGSCNSDGCIMLNWRLIHFAPDIVDYVIAHELAHLREMNHSQDFWAEVEQILPGFQGARDVLRRHDPADVPLL